MNTNFLMYPLHLAANDKDRPNAWHPAYFWETLFLLQVLGQCRIIRDSVVVGPAAP